MPPNGVDVPLMGRRSARIRVKPPFRQPRERSAPVSWRKGFQPEPLPLRSAPVLLSHPASLGFGSGRRWNLPPNAPSILDSKVPSPSFLEDARHEKTSYHFRKLRFGSDLG